MDRGEIYHTQASRSWRWAAEIVVQETILCHCYYGMGLTSQHPLVHGLVVRLQHGFSDSKWLFWTRHTPRPGSGTFEASSIEVRPSVEGLRMHAWAAKVRRRAVH